MTVDRRRNLVPAPRLLLTGDPAEDRRRARQWRRTYSPTMCEPLTAREQELNRLRHKRDTLDAAIRLEEAFAWKRVAARLNAVGIRV